MEQTENLDDDSLFPDTEKTMPSPNEDITFSNQTTIKSKSIDSGKTINTETISTNDKTTFLFGKEDIKKKMDNDLIDVPEIGKEDLEPEYFSKLIPQPFASKSNEEKVKINRNFLKDAEPFSITRLADHIKKTPDGLYLGFRNLDNYIKLPHRKLTLISSRPGHGKTLFMLNILLNMSKRYPGMHFLYYSYSEPREDIELKLINISSELPFSSQVNGITSNFNRWKYEFKTHEIDAINEKANSDPEYWGLKHFLSLSSRIHVIDSSYDITDLIDSIQSFKHTLPVGVVFIDYLQAVSPDKKTGTWTQSQQMLDIEKRLIETGNDCQIPIIAAVQLTAPPLSIPEYDGLSLQYLKEIGDPELISNLIIAIQNYSQSELIGSATEIPFKSRFYDEPFLKAEKMPDTFKDNHSDTVLLTKILKNNNGLLFEAELLLNKKLMKITD